MDISLAVVEDEDLIKSIMFIPEIWAAVAEDDLDQDEYFIVPNDLWLGVFVESELIGLFRFHVMNGVTLQMHIHILPEHRGKYAMKAAREMWKWFLSGANINKDFVKVTTSVPVIWPRVKKFSEINGFREEGLNRMSYKKNGIIMDQWMLGITTQEIEAQINV